MPLPCRKIDTGFLYVPLSVLVTGRRLLEAFLPLNVVGQDVNDDLVVLLLLQSGYDDRPDERLDALDADRETASVNRVLQEPSYVTSEPPESSLRDGLTSSSLAAK